MTVIEAVSPGEAVYGTGAIWPAYWIWYLGLLPMVALLPLYFPNGRLVSSRWRWAVRTTAVFSVVAVGIAMVLPGDE
jgi:hypothetical protein